eukprot:Polyplicarium_translucidae@DN824_c0_g2_i1.p1
MTSGSAGAVSRGHVTLHRGAGSFDSNTTGLSTLDRSRATDVDGPGPFHAWQKRIELGSGDCIQVEAARLRKLLAEQSFRGDPFAVNAVGHNAPLGLPILV